MRRILSPRWRMSLTLTVSVAATWSASALPGRIVVQIGDALPGGLTVSAINDPYVDGNGKVGLLVSASDSTRSIWIDTGGVWNSSQLAPDTVTGGEGTMGISNAGGFIYSPTYNGEDAVVTQHGLLMRSDDVVPGTGGLFSSFNSRPRMSADGTAWWISGLTATVGGASQGRAMMKCADPSNPSSAVFVFRSGDTMDGEVIDTTGIQFGYDVSDNGLHLINIMDWAGATTTDAAVVVDSVTVAREGSLVAGGNGTENWTSLNGPGVNNDADYIFSGDTTAATSGDQVIYCNGAVVAREGQIIDGVTLGASTTWTTINNLGEIAFLQSSTQTETIFWGPSTAAAGIVKLVSVNDTIDVNNDNVDDYTITDFNASAAIAPGLDMPDDGWIYADVDMTPIGGGTSVNAIVGFRTPQAPPECPGDVNGDGSVGLSDLSILLANFGTSSGAGPEDGDVDGDGDVDLSDLSILLANFGTIC